jgi:hypothetical protein
MKKLRLLLLLPLLAMFLLGGTAQAQEKDLPDPGILPDSPFYFLKIIFENIGDFFTFGDEAKAERALELSGKRLAEAKALMEKGDTETAQAAIAAYQEQLEKSLAIAKNAQDEGADTDAIFTSVAEATGKHQATLLSIREQVPEEAKEAILRALQTGKISREEAISALPKDAIPALPPLPGKPGVTASSGIPEISINPGDTEPVSQPGSG